MKDRTNQVAVVTGGAGGIGIASAEMWMKQNGKIVACDIDVEKGKAFEAKYPGKVVFQLCDTRKFDDLEKATGYYMDSISPRDFNEIQQNSIETYTKV